MRNCSPSLSGGMSTDTNGKSEASCLPRLSRPGQMDPDHVWFNHLQRSLNFLPQNGAGNLSITSPTGSSHFSRGSSSSLWSPSTSAAQSALLSAYMLYFFPPPPPSSHHQAPPPSLPIPRQSNSPQGSSICDPEND